MEKGGKKGRGGGKEKNSHSFPSRKEWGGRSGRREVASQTLVAKGDPLFSLRMGEKGGGTEEPFDLTLSKRIVG